MKVMAIYGNPRREGFVHGALDHVAQRLAATGAEVERLRLADAAIRDCVGCFQCLRTGVCSIQDDMSGIIERMRAADGFLTGASVRNGYFPALYKRFYERITYLLGFTRDLGGKHVLAIGAVGMATGKKHLRRQLMFDGFQTSPVAYLFFHVGIPTRLRVEDVAGRLDRAADRLATAIASHAPLPLSARLSGAINGFVMRQFMFKPNPGGVYDYIVQRWRDKGLM